jgi:tetratricopeptide (TPR) repeat protein
MTASLLFRRGSTGLALITLSMGAMAGSAAAQDLPLKRPVLTPIIVSCPTFAAPGATVTQVVDEANRLATLGQEASIEGDHRAARDLLKQAAQLNGRDATLAYRLGREYEEMQQRDDAVHEYCRYLALAPNAGDASQVAERVAKLLPATQLAQGAEMVREFKSAIASYDAHDWSAAADGFGKVMTGAPALSAPVYDRGVAYARDGNNASAIRNLSRYVQMEPQAPDAAAVRARIQTLRHGIPSAGTAFGIGLLPGGGQFYTGQPVLGAVVIAGAASGIALALRTRTITRDTLFQSPFGGTYPGTYTQTQHPTLAVGVAIAGGVTILGAVQAAIVAHGRGAGLTDADARAPSQSALLPHVGPVTVELPTVLQAPDGLRLALPIRVTFR